MTCIYCAGRRKGSPQNSLEHIWPQSLGGATSPPLFQSREVCETCNNLAGLWVDGGFLKSWFISNESAMAARIYLDPKKPGTTPFTYMGGDQEFPNQPEHVCERWIGQAGEHVYHIHLEDDDRWYGYAGGDFIRRGKHDAGRAYLVLTSQNVYWAMTALQSFVVRFKGARLFCLTKVEGMPPNLVAMFTSEREATTTEAAEIAWIKARPDGVQQKIRFSLNLNFSDRFLAKLSLGLGANLFGSSYCSSPYAEELRKLLWLKNSATGEWPNINGANFWQEAELSPLSKYMGWPGAWTISLQGMRDGFGLYLCTPGGRGMTMSISNDNSFWSSSEFQNYHQGVMYFVIPERQVFMGPVALPHYIAHKIGRYVDSQLASLEALKGEPSLLPKPR